MKSVAPTKVSLCKAGDLSRMKPFPVTQC